MHAYICRTCGVQYAPGDAPPERCPICEDERQYVGWEGQRWTTMEEMAVEGYRNTIREEEPSLTSIGTEPSFAIGQRALLVQTDNGNVLWDCISLLDGATEAAVAELGGIHAIAISHPHFYGSMATWSAAFGHCPVYIHAADRQWVQYPSPVVRFWEGVSTELLPGLTLINPGGHFEGSTALHWADGMEGRGALLSGDTVQVVMDRRYVSFMYSYPNFIPLPDGAIQRILESLRPYRFERIYGAWNGKVVVVDGAGAVERSAERYLRQR